MAPVAVVVLASFSPAQLQSRTQIVFAPRVCTLGHYKSHSWFPSCSQFPVHAGGRVRAWRKLRHRLLTLKQEVSLKRQENVKIASSFSLESSACLGSLHTHRPRPILSTPEAFLSNTNRRSRQSQSQHL